MSLLDSNRNGLKEIKPKKTASINDINNGSSNKSSSKKKKDSKGYSRKNDTTLTIDVRTKNKIKTMVLMGDADTLKNGFDVAMQIYYENLPKSKKDMFDVLYRSLNGQLKDE